MKAPHPALPEVVVQSFPGQREVEEESQWVAAAAAPHGGVSPEGIGLVWGLVGDVSSLLFPPRPPKYGRSGEMGPLLLRRVRVDRKTKT